MKLLLRDDILPMFSLESDFLGQFVGDEESKIGSGPEIYPGPIVGAFSWDFWEFVCFLLLLTLKEAVVSYL